MADLLLALRNRRLVTCMLGHFTVDSYAGLLPVLYPLLIHRFRLDLETVGLVTLAYSGLASVSQPLFGSLADRHGTRLTGLALAWTAAAFALVGLAPTFPVLVVMAGLAGLGSGAFHPFGALTVRGVLPSRGANTAMSVYVTGGTVGVATGPLIGIVLFGLFGVRGTLLMLLPGVAIGGYLLLAMRLRSAGRTRPERRRGPHRRLPLAPIAATVGVMMSRNCTVFTLQAFTPTWYHQLGYQPWFYGPLVTTLVLSSAMGTVGCGALADRFGRRSVIVGSLVLSIPVVALYVLLPGAAGFAWAVLVGFLAASTAPLTLMIAQELMASRAGLASGLVMGLAFVAGAIGVPLTGAVADHVGLQTALALQVGVVVLTIPVGLLLPGEARLRRLREEQEPRPGPVPALAAGK
ncbi:MAG TPA: MFS transporter [Candidatus Dormibacteraeota bacterium]|nr:MFS transporter [Candidatus Dormibacteraeota bacterium]